MHPFDGAALLGRLENLSDTAIAAFAAATATRQLGGFARFARDTELADPRDLEEIANVLWASLEGEPKQLDWSEMLDVLTYLLPADQHYQGADATLAEDAVSSFVYAIRFRLNKDVQEAVWAARRAYEAAEQAVIYALCMNPEAADSEDAKPGLWVERELERQNQDLLLLQSNAIDEVRERAFSNSLLSDQEAMLCSSEVYSSKLHMVKARSAA